MTLTKTTTKDHVKWTADGWRWIVSAGAVVVAKAWSPPLALPHGVLARAHRAPGSLETDVAEASTTGLGEGSRIGSIRDAAC